MTAVICVDTCNHGVEINSVSCVCICVCVSQCSILTLAHWPWWSHISAAAPHWSTSLPVLQLHWHQVDHIHMNGWLQRPREKRGNAWMSTCWEQHLHSPSSSFTDQRHSVYCILSFHTTALSGGISVFNDLVYSMHNKMTRLRGVWKMQRAEENLERVAVPLRPTPLVLQSLVSRWAGWEVRTTRCCMSLQVRFLLEQMYGKHTQRHTQPHKKEERETHRDTHMVRLVKIKLRHSNRSNTRTW